jgi:hypothetical protein
MQDSVTRCWDCDLTFDTPIGLASHEALRHGTRSLVMAREPGRGLPSFPVNDEVLDLLLNSVTSGHYGALGRLLESLSRAGGSDTGAVAEIIDGVHYLRDPQYSTSDAIEALVLEIKRLKEMINEVLTLVGE